MHRSCRITAGFGKKEITKVACFFSEAAAERPKRDSGANEMSGGAQDRIQMRVAG